MTVFPVLSGCWLSKACSIGFVVLIALPVTAPFQTVGVSELLGGNAHQRARFESFGVLLASSPDDTACSTIPPLDGTEVRLKLGSRSVNEIGEFASFHLRPLAQSVAPTGLVSGQPVTVLRL
jgi:hypothetical protein